MSENNGNDNTNLSAMFESMKSMMTDLMKLVKSNTNKVTTANTIDEELEDSLKSTESSEGSGSIEEEEEEKEEQEPNVDPTLNNAMNSVFDMLGSMFKNMDKYKDRPYLAFMPQIFTALSGLKSDDEDAVSVKDGATVICGLLKEKPVEELYEVDEFKKAVLQVSVGFQKMAITALKKQAELMETELASLNDGTSLDYMLESLYKKFTKK